MTRWKQIDSIIARKPFVNKQLPSTNKLTYGDQASHEYKNKFVPKKNEN